MVNYRNIERWRNFFFFGITSPWNTDYTHVQVIENVHEFLLEFLIEMRLRSIFGWFIHSVGNRWVWTSDSEDRDIKWVFLFGQTFELRARCNLKMNKKTRRKGRLSRMLSLNFILIEGKWTIWSIRFNLYQ